MTTLFISILLLADSFYQSFILGIYIQIYQDRIVIAWNNISYSERLFFNFESRYSAPNSNS